MIGLAQPGLSFEASQAEPGQLSVERKR